MVEALYFNTYYSFLKGNQKDTRMYYGILKEEFSAAKNPNILSKQQLQILKDIRSSLVSGKLLSGHWISDPSPKVMPNKPSHNLYQDDIVRKIYYDAFESLRSLVGSDTFLSLYNIEHPCGEYGAVDVVLKDKSTMYPLEVKRAEGSHDLIGQIMKYTLHFRLQLHLKLYEDVKPVTICNSYNPMVLNELKKMSVCTLKYTIEKDLLRLERV